MASPKHNWERYWVPRDGGFSLDSEGFLVSPARDLEWMKYWKTDVVSFSEMLVKPCLVLLGEPGIGKSYAIKDAEIRTHAARCGNSPTILFRDLGCYSSDSLLVEDVFKSPEFLSWRRNGGELHIFLDSFDECLMRVDALSELLAEQFARISSVQNLFLRIAARTAEWRTSLEDALRQKWGKDFTGVYELAPLTREQVLEAARAQLQEPEHFVAGVVASEVVSFAIKPLTLNLLLRVWKKRGGSLPPTQREIYEQGCLELCSDPESRQTPKLRRQCSPEHRLATASHIAAATFFCNRAAVWTAGSQAHKPDADISLSEIATGFVTTKGQRIAVTESSIREALDTGLFTSRGRSRMGWAHQTYGEFLAARYLVQEELSSRQSFDLLTHPHDSDRKLIPQLQETAAWAATPSTELFAHLTRVQPDILLRSDVATADASDKFSLVEALITAFSQDSVQGDWWGMRKRFRKLSHPGLVSQLRGHLLNPDLATNARVEAIFMADTCESTELLPDLVKLALNVREAQPVRQLAAEVVSRSKNAKFRKRLRPLALGQAGAETDDELRGAGLAACWPEYLTADELFTSLKVPDSRLSSRYHVFLSHELAEKLTLKDLPRALAWIASEPEGDDFIEDDYSGLVERILGRAVEHIDADGVLDLLASALLARLRKNDFVHGRTPPQLVNLLESRHDVRLKLVDAMVSFFEDAKQDSLKMARWGLRLLSPRDMSWLIERLQAAKSLEHQIRFAHLIRWVFYPDDADRISAVIGASQRYPVLIESMPYWLKPTVIGSDEARTARDSFFEDERHREEFEKRRNSKLLSPLPAERLVTLLDQFETGDLDAWWRLSFWLEIEDNGHSCKNPYHMDVRELTGWKKATDASRERMVYAAERYLCGREANPEQWFSRRNLRHFPAVAGFRALLLLANENPTAFEALSQEVWQRWMPAVMRPHHYDERDAHRLLVAKAFTRAPDDAINWVIGVVAEENKEGENLWILQKLPEEWPNSLGSALLKRIKLGKFKPQCFDQLLTKLLEHHVAGALDVARSQATAKALSQMKRRQSVLSAARLLMTHGERSDWPRIWNLIIGDSIFGKNLLEGFGYQYSYAPEGMLKILRETDVTALWEWMLEQYPIAEDPDRSRGGEVTTRHSMADLRDGLVSYLATIGTPDGCAELERLIVKYPQFAWFRHALLRGQEQMRRLTWQPVLPGSLFQLAANRRARLVESGDHLLEAIIDSLNVLQERLQGETPLAQFLWDSNHPKSEESISEWIKNHLDDDLKQRGVVLGREVQIHRFDRTDIHVTAVRRNPRDESFDNVKVIIEVKGSWHRELNTAMKTQLAGRYLKDSDCCHGLYLVGWFSMKNPHRMAKRRPNSKFPDRKAWEDYLVHQAQTLSADGQRIMAKVIDFSLRQPARRQKPVQRKKKPMR